jgi:cell division protein ZapD
MILSLIRDSATATPEVAEGGFYQKSLDTSIAYQLIRVILPDDHACFAEISAGKHRFTLRFMQLTDLSSRATQCEQDIHFHLACCVL